MNLTSEDPDETEEIGFKLGRRLKRGVVVCLYGDLGAGKTTFVKGIARSLGIDPRDIASASFTIIAEYDSDPVLCHIDLYRIRDADDAYHAGVWDYIGGDMISVVEWPQIISDGLPEDTIKVFITIKESDRRELLIEGIDEKAWNNL